MFKLDLAIYPSSLDLFEEKERVLQRTNLSMNEMRGDDLRLCEFPKQDTNLLRSISGDESAVNSSSQAVELMKILDAVYRSSQIGAEVPVS